jgi:16S rRNA (guanine527-N7)-methyltransferase
VARGFGFLGPGPVASHVEHALAFADVLDDGTAGPRLRAVDLGAGGGIPGLVVALALPASTWTLVEAGGRRAAFLERAVGDLGLGGRVEVVRARAEAVGRSPGRRGGADWVVARSFGPPATTAECAAPLLAPGGRLAVSEPPAGGAPGRWPTGPLRELGLVVDDVRPGPPALVVLRRDGPCPDRFPRRDGVPGRRPLW